jgi:voltage-gated potassium channel
VASAAVKASVASFLTRHDARWCCLPAATADRWRPSSSVHAEGTWLGPNDRSSDKARRPHPEWPIAPTSCPLQQLRSNRLTARGRAVTVVKDRQQAFERFSRMVDGPMMVLALAMIPIIVIPVVFELPARLDAAFLAVDYLTWAAFAVEYLAKLYLAPDRWRFFKGNIPDLIIVVVPMLRPLRVLRATRLLRLLRLTRLIAFAVEGVHEARSILRRRGLSWVLLVGLALNLVAAALVLTFERDMPNGNIHSYPDALWWAVTTVTTVGYGDRFPMSPAGRGVAVVLMVSGIALFGVITASIAAYFVEQKGQQEDQDLADRLDQVLERLDAIEAKLPMDEPSEQVLAEAGA